MNSVLSVIFLSLALAASAQPHPRGIPEPERQNALQLEQQGKTADAILAWTELSKTHPESPEPYAHLGLLQAHQEQYKTAIPFYRKALALDPSKTAVRLNLGLAFFKDGQLKNAASTFTVLRKQLPASSAEAPRLDVLIGLSYYGLAQYRDAVPFLHAASKREQQNSPLLLALAHSCLWSKQYKCVMDTYHQILFLNAESAEADMLAGEALDEMKDNEGSTKMFRAAVKADPKEPNVHFGLGYLLWTQKQYTEAVDQFKAELENDPNHAQALLYLGDSYLQLNNSADARSPLAKAHELNSSLWLADLDLGIIDSDAGRNDDALRELRTSVKLKPDEVSVHWHLARHLRKVGQKEEAQAEFEAAKKLNKAADEDLYKKIAANGEKHRKDQISQATTQPKQ